MRAWWWVGTCGPLLTRAVVQIAALGVTSRDAVDFTSVATVRRHTSVIARVLGSVLTLLVW